MSFFATGSLVFFKTHKALYVVIFGLVFFLCSCQKEKTLFELMPSDQTGITFENTITEKDTVNILDAEFVYNGGGVGIGDLNGDGLQDVYLAGNQVDNKLYLNRGNLTFEDITATAHATKRNAGEWSSGVSMVDINLDGKLDIYVCNTFSPTPLLRKNLLFVNQGNNAQGVPIFRQMAEEYGLANESHSSHATFFDYDHDGDLDVFIGVNYIDEIYPNQFKTQHLDGSANNRDILLRNDWSDSLKHPIFKDVSLEAGIVHDGYSHSSTLTDFNEDGWMDVYVANDYLSNDIVYINNGMDTQGKHLGFSNHVGDVLKHLSYSAMGSDAADINNDGLIDLVTTEMLPAYNKRRKLMMPANTYQNYLNTEQYHYQYQYFRNTLQLNRGKNPQTGLPVFSDIAFLADVQATDWSWSPMLADFDNDGFRDLVVTNGFPKDVTDQDFSSFRKGIESSLVSKDELHRRIPEARFPSFAFKNNGNLTFDDVSKPWGLTQPAFSNGATYADLDNDGDLDLVFNNIDDKAFVYRNTLYDAPEKINNHYLRVRLTGTPTNPAAIGARVTVYQRDSLKIAEVSGTRGYLSTPETILHFGLGTHPFIDSLVVRWPDGKQQRLTTPKADQLLSLSYRNATNTYHKAPQMALLLATVSAKNLGIDYLHQENDFIDFNIQKTLPHKFSQYGPAAAVGDLNGDGLDDFVIGGSGRLEGYMFTQKPNGTFTKSQLHFKVGEQKKEEELGLLLFDADNDGDNDLYVTFGSYQHPPNSPLYQDVLLINDGKGRLQKDSLALPVMRSSKQCVKAVDYDHDGDLDLFVGSRVKAERYPEPDRSYILRNDSQRDSRSQRARFTDVTAQLCPQLTTVGLVSDALWSDFDNDGWTDLVLAGEWMPLTFLKNENGKQFRLIDSGLQAQAGWWNSLSGADFDNDGDIDYIAGNFGLNTFFRCTSNEPLTIYGKDFDENGRYDAFISCFFKDSLGAKHEYFYHSRDDMVKQLILVRKKFERYADFGAATVSEVFSEQELKGALTLKAQWMQSSYVENLGQGRFQLRALPVEAQVAPVYGTLPCDIDQDGLLDVLLVGNDYGMEVFQGRADGFYGLVLKNTGKGRFTAVSLNKSGFFVPNDARALTRLVTANNQELYMATQNRSDLRFFALPSPPSTFVKLLPMEAYGVWTLANGKKQRVEFYYGSTFLSQESRNLSVPKNAVSLELFFTKGRSRLLTFAEKTNL